MSNQRPIFIIGCPRSGTTMLRLILDTHPNISCGPESGFLVEFKRSVENHWSHLALYGFDQAYWEQKTADYFATFQADYASRRGKQRWAEKTPQYTPHLDYILRLFPDSQIIHIIRDGRAVMASHLQRWGYRAALRGMKQWRQFIEIAQRVGKQLPSEQYYELRYETLIQWPEQTLQKLMCYLQEPWDPTLLQFMEAPHDVQGTYRRRVGAVQPTANQPAANQPTALYASRLNAWRDELPLPLRVAFSYWAGSLLHELGYE